MFELIVALLLVDESKRRMSVGDVRARLRCARVALSQGGGEPEAVHGRAGAASGMISWMCAMCERSAVCTITLAERQWTGGRADERLSGVRMRSKTQDERWWIVRASQDVDLAVASWCNRVTGDTKVTQSADPTELSVDMNRCTQREPPAVSFLDMRVVVRVAAALVSFHIFRCSQSLSTDFISSCCASIPLFVLFVPCLRGSMDYSKWDVMAAEEDRDEQQKKADQRRKNKDDYYRQQQERIQQHEQKKQQSTQPQPTASSALTQHDDQHQHDHHDHHDHDHSRDQPAPDTTSTVSSELPAYRRSCGCGFTDVDTLLAMQKYAAANPGPSAEEKRQKQLDAIHAIRTHAKELYSTEQYQHAYSIYERGSLIIAGMTDLPPATQQAVEQHELAITHNMALCQLQLRNYQHAAELARMALQLTPEHDSDDATKAHYRLLQCHVRLGQWDEAEVEVADINKRGGWKGLEDEVRLMRKMREAEKVKERQYTARMRERMREEQEKQKERQRKQLDESKEGPAIDTQ